jgi:hypothetical protein
LPPVTPTLAGFFFCKAPARPSFYKRVSFKNLFTTNSNISSPPITKKLDFETILLSFLSKIANRI